MKFLGWIAVASTLAACPVAAQTVESTVTATNGVEVTVNSDDFASRYEYSSPLIRFTDGGALVGAIKRAGSLGPTNIQGFFVYSGDWRYYDSAIFKGGDPVTFISNGRDVGHCSSSRYSGASCTLSENFTLTLSATEIASHSENGIVAIQIRSARTHSAVIIEVPVSYFAAIDEVAGR